jgi:hypothetical protein
MRSVCPIENRDGGSGQRKLTVSTSDIWNGGHNGQKVKAKSIEITSERINRAF